MGTSEVYKAIRRNTSLEYLLENTYVFAWESDVFGISKSNYITEIEVKSSRSDFKADFYKVKKHNMLKSAYNKKSFAVFKGDLRYEYDEEETILNRGTWEHEKTGKLVKRQGSTPKLKAPKNERWLNVKELYTDIRFVKVFCPHRFYYACPEGMIKKDEVPKYAGLYWINDKGMLKTVKSAPLIHKTKYDLTKVLLHKFYHKSLNQEIRLMEIKQQYEYLTHNEMRGTLVDEIENMPSQTQFNF